MASKYKFNIPPQAAQVHPFPCRRTPSENPPKGVPPGIFGATFTILLFTSLILFQSCANRKIIVFETPYGEMKAILYDETPIHKNNFLKLAGSGQFDSMLFHRVIEGFMIQTGDVSTSTAGQAVDYTLEAELMPERYFHERGTLAAARAGDEINPEKRSSGSQFYIVQGRTFDEEGLQERTHRRAYLKLYALFQHLLKSKRVSELTEKYHFYINKYQADSTYDINASLEKLIFNSKPVLERFFGDLTDPGYSNTQKQVYASKGGAPHLDGEYTVFGKVVEGLEVIDKIAAVPTNDHDQPIHEVKVTVRVLSISEKEYQALIGNYEF